MKPCPKCGKSSGVLESRQTHDHTYRRRECQNFKCQHKWTTYEIHSDEFDKLHKYNQIKNLIA